MIEPEKRVGVFVQVFDVFPEVKNDFETFKLLIQNLSLTDTIIWCARINLYISHFEVEHAEGQQAVISRFLKSSDIDMLNKFVKKIGGTRRVKVFFPGQLLELIRWVVRYSQDKSDDGITFNNPEVGREFVKAALIASDIWSNRVFAERFKLDEGIDKARTQALGAIRKSIEAQSSAPDFSRSLGRGWTLFRDYFPNYSTGFEELFQSVTGLSIEQYYISISSIMTNFMKPSLDSNIFSINELRKSNFGEALEKYIDLESSNVSDLFSFLWNEPKKNTEGMVPAYNYRPLRERPIFRTLDGRAIILDPSFLSERAMVGPLFHLIKHHPHKANEYFSAFGYAFENYTRDILSRMFHSSESLVRRLSCNFIIADCNGKKAEVDACLNDLQEVVVFEIKASWIREDEILTDNYSDYLKQLREKYGVTEGNNNKIKGVGQLARIIKIMASEAWLQDTKEFELVKYIYPILLVYDPFMSSPIHGAFLAEEFKKYLCPEKELEAGELIKGQIKIAPLILMTIEELENLETSIEHFGFRDFLRDYSKSCPDRMMSLNDYIYFSGYRSKIYHNRNLAIKGLDLLDRTGKEVFPEVYHQG